MSKERTRMVSVQQLALKIESLRKHLGQAVLWHYLCFYGNITLKVHEWLAFIVYTLQPFSTCVILT